MRLLKNQKNEITRYITAKGFSAFDFEFSGLDNDDINFEIYYTGETSYRFKVTDFDDDDIPMENPFQISYSPGLMAYTANRATGKFNSDFFNLLGHWLNSIKKEIQTPDLWEQWRNAEMPSESTKHDYDNSSFEPIQAEEIKALLTELQKTCNLIAARIGETPEQIKESESRINDNINYLRDSIDRVGKKDFALLATSIFFDLAVDRLAQPEIALFWRNIAHYGLDHLKALGYAAKEFIQQLN